MHKRTLILSLVFGLVATYQAQPYRPVVVVGESMSPTFASFQIVAATRTLGSIQRGDVVVFRHEGTEYVKRVAGLPGDRITSYVQTGQVVYPENTIFKRFMDLHYERQVMVVPRNSLFVTGDNRKVSVDSRQFGPIKIADVTAKLLDGASDQGIMPGLEISSVLPLRTPY